MKRVLNILKYIFAILICLIFLIPVAWVIICSFKNNTELYQWPLVVFPTQPTLGNYILAFEKGNFGLYFYNSMVVTIVATIITVLINTAAGFGLAKYEFKGRDALLVAFISTLMIPLEVIMIPIFTVIRTLGLYNSLWGIIIPPAATPTGLFIMRQYLLSIPDELLHAARIDGASELYIFRKLILPMAKPVIAVLSIFSCMWRWNDFLWPLIVISNPEKFTIQLAISNFVGEFNVDWNSLLAMSVVTIIPLLFIFLIFQRQFVQGMITSGMKE